MTPPASKRSKVDATLRRDYGVDMSDLLGRADEPVEAVKDTRPEWERYVELPQVSLNEDLLQWWQRHEDEFPQISKMAYQVLGCPACSSGVERLFSKAGRNYTKDRKSNSAESMGDILFATNLKAKKKKQLVA